MYGRPGIAPLYIGEICAIGLRTKYLFRLFEIKSGKLVAERTFYHPDPQILWGDNQVWYGDDDEYVALPPALLDRFMAKLP